MPVPFRGNDQHALHELQLMKQHFTAAMIMSSDRAPVPNHVMAYGEREIYESAKFPPQPHHRTRLIASDAAETHAELESTIRRRTRRALAPSTNMIGWSA